MAGSPKRDGKRVNLIVAIQQVAAGFTSTYSHSCTGIRANPSCLRTLLCFLQCNRLYLVSFGVVLSNSGQATCFAKCRCMGHKTDFEIYAKTYSDLPFLLMGKIPTAAYKHFSADDMEE